MQKYSCIHCGISNDNLGSHATHVRWCDKNSKNEDLIRKYCVEKICTTCGVSFCTLNSRRNTCSYKCQKSMSNEAKRKISDSRKKYLSQNPESHVWKRKNKFKSVPCDKVKKYLIDRGISFFEEYKVLENRSFSIDIAFPELKIGIEINGNQHYNPDGSLKKYYQDRHDLIVASGWELREIHYSKCFNENNLSIITDFLGQIDLKNEKSYVENKLNNKISEKIVLPKGQTTILKTDARWLPIKDIIFEKNIDFSKYGWVKEVAELIGIKPQKVNKWMKRYHKNFYETYCFKRKL